MSTAGRIAGKDVILTTKETINTEQQPYCLTIKATGSLDNKTATYYQRYKIVIQAYIIFTDGTVKRINYVFIKTNKGTYQFSIPPAQGCFKVNIEL